MLEAKISQKLTLHAKKCLKEARDLAASLNSPEIKPEHLLFAIYLEKGCMGNTILKNMGINKNVFEKIGLYFENNKRVEEQKTNPRLSSGLKNIVTKAYYLASNFNYPYVGTEHFVYALAQSSDQKIRELLGKSKPKTQSNLENILESALSNDAFPGLSKIFDLPEISLSKKNTAKHPATPYLNQFCLNLNKDTAKREETIIGREAEISRLINILGRKNKNNPILIGDPGVGKTALVSKLAQKINSGEVPPQFLNKKILSLDIALVVAGTTFRGEFEARLKEIIREAAENKDIILFIDEIHTAIGAGNANGGLDVANILKPVLSRGEIQCIGSTTGSEYRKYFEKDGALERRFQPLRVGEPSLEETKNILKGIKESFEKFHNIEISEEAVSSAVNLSVRYINNRFLPDKAIDLIDETASAIRGKNNISDLAKKINALENSRERLEEQKNNLVGQEKYDEALALRQQERELSKKIETLKKKRQEENKEKILVVKGSDIAKTVSQITGIPLEKLATKKFRDSLKNLEKNLSAKIIGQSEALEKISNILIRSSSGISNPDRPMGSFLFLGPTGVGKTLTAKVLAEDFFGSAQNLVRIDMSEFMEKHSVSRLIGAPAGYIGYEEGGKLTEKIRHQPYSVVLFDEIEKAHPDVFNIFLQILEDGMLTDAEGKEINFKNTVIILTSNLGTSEFTSEAKIGFESKNKKTNRKFEEIKNKVIEGLKKEIRPEIINRLDHIVVFSPLGEKEIQKISKLELEKFKKRLALQEIKFSYSENLIDYISKKSMAIDQGARLIRRNIQEMAENPIAKAIVEGKVKNNKISLNVEEDKIIIC
ncbi:MAG: ATP-dependent Clp protease ATP-binding subunit [bacterium]|nr:ATP-dependent Clp protease ATP-binding subunit [bacterium]